MPKRKPKRTESTYGKGKRQKIAIDLGDDHDDKGVSYLGRDHVSQLPDDVLILILSLLSIREALSICSLSKRWRYLWKHTKCLNFDDIDALSKVQARKESRRQQFETSRYNWVHQVLQLHQGSTLDEFKIRSSSSDCYKYTSEIDKWIEFALAKEVQRLEIDLQGDRHWLLTREHGYIFPEKPYKSHFGIFCIKSLRHLSLTFLNITGELVEHFLSSCPLLEHLCISGSAHLVNLKVAGLALPLKFLKISDCINLHKVEIFAPNLASFIYDGVMLYKRGILLKHVPLLVNVSISEEDDSPYQVFRLFTSYFPQLVTLNLHLDLSWRTFKLPEFQELISLKELTLSVETRDDRSLLDLISLIERSPSLRRFTLKLNWIPTIKYRRNVREPNICPHQCLKVVKFSGFVGSDIDTELAMYFITNAVVLETFIIECSTKLDFATSKEKMTARREFAFKIGNKLPPGAELIVM